MKFTTNLLLSMLLCIFVLSCASCDKKGKAKIQKTLVSTQILGSANDGDPTTAKDSYKTGDTPMAAKDSKTKASSIAPKDHTLGGRAEAETLNPSGQTADEDEARSTSFNKEISSLVVEKAGTFTFKITLNVKKIELVGDGKLDISVSANVLDKNGNTMPNAQITSTTFKSKKNANGTVDIDIKQETNPTITEHPLADSSFSKALKKPDNGLQLSKGNYRIEFDLRIIATASTTQGPNNLAHRASVESVTAKIELLN